MVWAFSPELEGSVGPGSNQPGSWEACKTQESSSPKMGSIQVLTALTEIRVI